MTIENVISVLSRVGMSELSSAIGGTRLSRLAELGVPMRPTTISEALFQEQGYSVFRNRRLRFEILNSLPEQDLRTVYGGSGEIIDIDALSKFTWGKNEKTAKFLTFFGLSIEEAFPKSDVDTDFHMRTEIHRPLFDYQNSVRKQLVSFLNDADEKRIIAHMPTGSGKTRTTLELVSDFIRGSSDKKPPLVVWMAHSDELCEQAVESFKSIWSRLGSLDADIFRFWGGRTSTELRLKNPTFIVTSFQSCHSAITSSHDERFEIMAKIRSECDLLIVDEAHLSVAPTYASAIGFLCNQNTKLIGLTATPGRHHIGHNADSTRDLAAFYNNNKVTFDAELVGDQTPIEFLQARGILSNLTKYRIETGVDVELSSKSASAVSEFLDLPSEVLKSLGENAKRTSVVATHVLVLSMEQKKQTIVFCPSKENASDMALLLQTKGCKARAITGETAFADRRQWIEDFKAGEIQVLTNFGVLTTGFDAPKTEAVVIARPTTSVVLYSQMVGRGLRGKNVGGTEYCTLVDVVDNITNMPEIPHAFTYFDEFFGG